MTTRSNGRYQVQIWHLAQSRYVGCYPTKETAASACRIAEDVLSKSTSQSTNLDNSVLMKTVRLKINQYQEEACLLLQDKGKGEGGLPVQVGRIHNVSSLGLALSANSNECPHQDKGKGKGGLPVQVGHIHNVSSLGLALSANHNECSHQDKGRCEGGLIVQVGCIFRKIYLIINKGIKISRDAANTNVTIITLRVGRCP